MSSYYNDVYLKRLNRFGTNLQERIINKKEYDFNNYVNKSPNKVTVFIQDYKFNGVLQTKTYDEIETIDYFLTYKSISVPTGSILKVLDIKNPEIYTYWIVICKDNFISAGYNRYTVVKLDREIRWITDEGYLYKTLVHISGAGKSESSKRITNTYVTKENSVVFLPNQTLTITTKDSKQIKRGLRTNINEQVWKISGIDNISNEGVSYITLEQDYTDNELDNKYKLPDDTEDIEGIADGYKLEYWNFNSSLTEINEDVNGITYPTLILNLSKKYPISFNATYFDEETNATLGINIEDNSIIDYDKINRTIKGTSIGTTFLTVYLEEYPDINQKFYIKIEEEETVNNFSVESPTRLKMNIPAKFYSKNNFELIDCPNYISIRKLNNFEENGIEYYAAELTCSRIEKNLTLKFNSLDTNEIYIKVIQVESPWIGGY
jgi:hypothetical protein